MSRELAKLIGPSWKLFCHHRKVRFEPVSETHFFCNHCQHFMFHSTKMCTSEGPRPPSNDAEDHGRRLQNLKSHLHFLTLKQKRKKTKKQNFTFEFYSQEDRRGVKQWTCVHGKVIVNIVTGNRKS